MYPRFCAKMLTIGSLSCSMLLFGCDSEAVKDPESCKTEGKESGEKCKVCCVAAGKSGHRWMSGDCKCI